MNNDETKNLIQKPFNALTVPVASAAGKTLSDIWELVFGGFGVFVDKKRAQRAKCLEDFKLTLEKRVTNIPEEHLIEPKLSIVGPTLEASKYYYEEKEIREMFAYLIASSMDERVSNAVHPAYVETIKQMTSADARLFSRFYYPEHTARAWSINGSIWPRKVRIGMAEEASAVQLKRQGLIALLSEYEAVITNFGASFVTVCCPHTDVCDIKNAPY